MPKDNQRYVVSLCEEVLGSRASEEHCFDWLCGDPSPKTGRTRMLAVDAYWHEFRLVVEFHERQHWEPVRFFDKPGRLTVSGVHRGEQRRIYDQRRTELIPQHGLSLVVIRMDEFEVFKGRIVPRPLEDRAIVADHLKPFRNP